VVDGSSARQKERVMSDTKKSPPYITGANIDKLFERIRTMQPPKKVDSQWAKSNGISPKQPGAVTGVLLWLGVIDQGGIADPQIWNGIRLPQTRKDALAERVRDAYSVVFDGLDLEESDRGHLEAVFVNGYGAGNPKNQVKCFLRLCEIAGIDVGASVNARSSTAPAPKGPSNVLPKQRSPKTAPPTRNDGRSAAQVMLNVEIPASWTREQIRDRITTVAEAATEAFERAT
jgi:hypothetical protein